MTFFLLAGVSFVPSSAKADFFSSLFGGSASANANIPDPNSQNMAILQPKISPDAIIQEKDSKKEAKDSVDLNKDVNIVSDSALLPNVNPAVPDGNDMGEDVTDEISVYVVRKGDSLAQIAEMFDVSTNTILWANDLKKGDKLSEGDVLLILPVSGIKHTVLKGQTLKGIAKKYNVDVADIAGFNGIASNAELAVGDELIIPEGEMADDGGNKTPTKKDTKPSTKKTPAKQYNLKDLAGYFMNPMPGARLTQGLHDGGAIDLAAPKGTPILAAAAGTVIFAKMGWNGAYGNLVILEHPNGTKTLYGHQSKIATTVGARVSQGEVIGYEGSTGRSTGPHLHFKIEGAKNPGAYLRVGSTLNASWK